MKTNARLEASIDRWVTLGNEKGMTVAAEFLGRLSVASADESLTPDDVAKLFERAMATEGGAK